MRLAYRSGEFCLFSFWKYIKSVRGQPVLLYPQQELLCSYFFLACFSEGFPVGSLLPLLVIFY